MNKRKLENPEGDTKKMLETHKALLVYPCLTNTPVEFSRIPFIGTPLFVSTSYLESSLFLKTLVDADGEAKLSKSLSGCDSIFDLQNVLEESTKPFIDFRGGCYGAIQWSNIIKHLRSSRYLLINQYFEDLLQYFWCNLGKSCPVECLVDVLKIQKCPEEHRPRLVVYLRPLEAFQIAQLRTLLDEQTWDDLENERFADTGTPFGPFERPKTPYAKTFATFLLPLGSTVPEFRPIATDGNDGYLMASIGVCEAFGFSPGDKPVLINTVDVDADFFVRAAGGRFVDSAKKPSEIALDMKLALQFKHDGYFGKLAELFWDILETAIKTRNNWEYMKDSEAMLECVYIILQNEGTYKVAKEVFVEFLTLPWNYLSLNGFEEVSSLANEVLLRMPPHDLRPHGCSAPPAPRPYTPPSPPYTPW
jgi:hypothetical protein